MGSRSPCVLTAMPPSCTTMQGPSWQLNTSSRRYMHSPTRSRMSSQTSYSRSGGCQGTQAYRVMKWTKKLRKQQTTWNPTPTPASAYLHIVYQLAVVCTSSSSKMKPQSNTLAVFEKGPDSIGWQCLISPCHPR